MLPAQLRLTGAHVYATWSQNCQETCFLITFLALLPIRKKSFPKLLLCRTWSFSPKMALPCWVSRNNYIGKGPPPVTPEVTPYLFLLKATDSEQRETLLLFFYFSTLTTEEHLQFLFLKARLYRKSRFIQSIFGFSWLFCMPSFYILE